MEKICEYDEYICKALQIQNELKERLAGKDDLIEELPVVEVIEEYLEDYEVVEFDESQLTKVKIEPPQRKPKKSKPVKSKEFPDQPDDLEGYKRKGRYPILTSMISCPEPGCPRRFDKIRRYRSHIQYHAKTRAFICQQCGKDFKTKTCLTTHIKNVHRDHFIICDACGKNFSSKNGLIIHYQSVHLNLMKYVCSACGKAFNNRASLRCHQFTHDPENKNVVCGICSARFYNKSKLSRHMKTHTEKEYQCQLCSRMFNHRYNVTAHLKAVHRIGANELKASPPAINICQLCGRVFDRKKTLELHLRTVHEAVPFTASMGDLSE